MKQKFRKGTRVKLLGREALGTIVYTFKDQCVNWCVVRNTEGTLLVESEYNCKKVPSYIHTLLDLVIYEDQARIVASVAKMLAANSPYMKVIEGGIFPKQAGEVRGVKK